MGKSRNNGTVRFQWLLRKYRIDQLAVWFSYMCVIDFAMCKKKKKKKKKKINAIAAIALILRPIITQKISGGQFFLIVTNATKRDMTTFLELESV